MNQGAATYAVLDVVFLVVAVAVAVAAGLVAMRRVARRHGPGAARRWRGVTVLTGVVVGVVLVVATVVFDNVIVGSGIVAYDATRISGVRLGVVPVEDLAYAVAALLLLPSLAVFVGPPWSDADGRPGRHGDRGIGADAEVDGLGTGEPGARRRSTERR